MNNNTTRIISYVAVFFLGVIITRSAGTPPETSQLQECPSVIPDTAVVSKELLTRLYETDNRGFAIAGSGLHACSAGIDAILEGDERKLSVQIDLLEQLNTSLEEVKTEREAIIAESGI